MICLELNCIEKCYEYSLPSFNDTLIGIYTNMTDHLFNIKVSLNSIVVYAENKFQNNNKSFTSIFNLKVFIIDSNNCFD